MRSANIDVKAQSLEIVSELMGQAKLLYDISPLTKMTLLSYNKNMTCLIEDVRDGLYTILRIYRPDYHTKEEIDAEMQWLHALSKNQPPVVLPEPVCGIDGHIVQNLQFPSSLNPCYCVMFSFLRGKTFSMLDEKELVHYFVRLGEITAILHQNAFICGNAAWLCRPVWDFDTLLGSKAHFGLWNGVPLHSTSVAGISYNLNQIFNRTAKLIKSRLEHFGKSPARFGFINADMQLSHLLLYKNKIAVLDFDDCGTGWFLYDFATAVSFLEDKSYVTQLASAWLEGYRRQRNMTNEEKAEIPTFVIMRRLVLLCRLVNHFDYDVPAGYDSGFIDKTAAIAEKYLSMFS